MVEELLPASITLMAQENMHKGIVPGLYGLSKKRHPGLLGRSAGFFHIALSTGTDNIFPNRFSAHTPWYDMIQRQFTGRLALATILAFVFVSREDISSIKFHLAARQTVIKQQADNTRHGDIEIYGGHPIVSVRLEVAPEPVYLAPALEIIVRISALLK